MKLEAFKKLIKESVREVLREELGKEDLNESLNFTSKDVIARQSGLPSDVKNSLRSKMGMQFGFEEPAPLKVDNTNPNNAYMDFIMDSAKSMTPQELSGLKNYG